MTARLHRGALALSAFLVTLLLAGCTTGDGNLIDMGRNPWSLGCCGILVLILDIIAIVEVIGSGRDLGSKLLWIAVIIIFPLFGCVAYYFFGR